jgi:hypothetical protein
VADYNDGNIECDGKGIRVRGYYFPWGTKVIPYSAVKGVQRVSLGTLRGKLRIWGTGNMKYWANLDTKRPSKSVGLILDLGKAVKPFITPDDADAVETLVRERAALGPSDGSSVPSPFL